MLQRHFKVLTETTDKLFMFILKPANTCRLPYMRYKMEMSRLFLFYQCRQKNCFAEYGESLKFVFFENQQFFMCRKNVNGICYIRSKCMLMYSYICKKKKSLIQKISTYLWVTNFTVISVFNIWDVLLQIYIFFSLQKDLVKYMDLHSLHT